MTSMEIVIFETGCKRPFASAFRWPSNQIYALLLMGILTQITELAEHQYGQAMSEAAEA